MKTIRRCSISESELADLCFSHERGETIGEGEKEMLKLEKIDKRREKRRSEWGSRRGERRE